VLRLPVLRVVDFFADEPLRLEELREVLPDREVPDVERARDVPGLEPERDRDVPELEPDREPVPLLAVPERELVAFARDVPELEPEREVPEVERERDAVPLFDVLFDAAVFDGARFVVPLFDPLLFDGVLFARELVVRARDVPEVEPELEREREVPDDERDVDFAPLDPLVLRVDEPLRLVPDRDELRDVPELDRDRLEVDPGPDFVRLLLLDLRGVAARAREMPSSVGESPANISSSTRSGSAPSPP
jgi:hypothetical protein